MGHSPVLLGFPAAFAAAEIGATVAALLSRPAPF